MQIEWRFYAAASGHVPVLDFMARLSSRERAELLARMREVEVSAPHRLPPPADRRFGRLRQLSVPGSPLRITFSVEGPSGQVLLGLDGNRGGEQQVKHLALARQRLEDWRRRHAEAQRSQFRRDLG